MADPDALRYILIAQADLEEAQRMLELSGFRDSSIGFRFQQACEKTLKSWIQIGVCCAPVFVRAAASPSRRSEPLVSGRSLFASIGLNGWADWPELS